MYPWQSPHHKKESNVGRPSFEIPLEFISTLLMSELALFCRKLFPTTSQDSDRPRENVDAHNEFRALCVHGRRSLPIQCSCACQRLLRFCTSSRFGKFVSVSSLEFVTLLATVQALCSLTNQVLELYRLDEIVVRTKILDHQDVLQRSLAFWMLQSDNVF